MKDHVSLHFQTPSREVKIQCVKCCIFDNLEVFEDVVKHCFKCLRHSNDPDKNCSIPHVETVLFSDKEFINRWKAGL